jgi:hypothetical protein
LESFRAFGGLLHQGLGFHHPVGHPIQWEIQIYEIERELGDSGTWLFLPSPDLYSWRVSEHLEATFIRAEPARVSVI